ncbi:MAG TPA: hypothetical protein VEB40_01010 [Flavipsychrobacter sp.]|nr:hypothetical protein [Flavipsychrobacter sp.]
MATVGEGFKNVWEGFLGGPKTTAGSTTTTTTTEPSTNYGLMIGAAVLGIALIVGLIFMAKNKG